MDSIVQLFSFFIVFMDTVCYELNSQHGYEMYKRGLEYKPGFIGGGLLMFAHLNSLESK